MDSNKRSEQVGRLQTCQAVKRPAASHQMGEVVMTKQQASKSKQWGELVPPLLLAVQSCHAQRNLPINVPPVEINAELLHD